MQKESYRQHTLSKKIELLGIEPFGGNSIRLTNNPSESDTGIIFTDGKEEVQLDNDYLKPSWRLSLVKTMVLSSPESKLKIRSLEHLLGTFWVYGIDNARIKVDLYPKISYRILHHFGIALRNNLPVIYTADLERGLCDRIEEVGTQEQAKKAYLRLKEVIDTGKLKLEPIGGEDVRIRAITEYKVSSGEVVKDDVTISLTPKEYKSIAHARAFLGVPMPSIVPKGLTRKTGIVHSFPTIVPKGAMRFLGNFLYLGFGLGHGANETNVFYAPRSEAEWRAEERLKGELAYHTIIDRIGDFIARLDLAFNARPAGIKLTCRFAGHTDTHNFIRACQTEYRDKFYFEE